MQWKHSVHMDLFAAWSWAYGAYCAVIPGTPEGTTRCRLLNNQEIKDNEV